MVTCLKAGRYSLILALNSNSEKRQLCLTINNAAVTNSKDIANDFNDFFVSIGPELAKDIHSDINPLTYVNNVNNSIVIFMFPVMR